MHASLREDNGERTEGDSSRDQLRPPASAHLDVLGGQHVVTLAGLELAVLAQRVQRLEGEVGADGVGAIADEGAEVVHLARFRALQQQPHTAAHLRAHQVVVHPPARQQRADRAALLACAGAR